MGKLLVDSQFTGRRYCGNSLPSYTYILMHRSGRLFKVGKANDVVSRAKVLGLEAISQERSFALRTTSPKEAKRVERMLHRVFWASRVPREVAMQEGVPYDGSGEWFWSECRYEFADFVVSHCERLGCEWVNATELWQSLEVEAENREARELRRNVDRVMKTFRLPRTLASELSSAVFSASSISGRRITEQDIVEEAIETFLANLRQQGVAIGDSAI